MKLTTKYSIVALLVKMGLADMTMQKKELEYIYFVGQKLGLDINEIMDIMDHPEQHPLQIPYETTDRLVVLYHLLHHMNIDGDMANEEIHLIKETSLKLGFRPELTNEVILQMHQSVKQQLTEEMLLQKLKVFFN